MAQASKTFRIFVSSTFSDLKEERNALQKHVFPKLRDLCVQHGCRFQTIDLRWGVSEEAALDQQTMRICLDEIARCQRVTPRPNFIVLLGDRYGWHPLPTEIPEDEFEEILRRLPTDEEERKRRQALLEEWYRRDDNTVPPVYCLQPRTGEFWDYKVWEGRVERPLRSILVQATAAMELTTDEHLKYTASATEQEIVQGALNVPDAPEHVFCFFRTIKTPRNLPLVDDLPPNGSAKDFVDLVEIAGGYQLDAEAHYLLEQLKHDLRQRLSNHVYDYYEAKWTGDGITTDHIGTLPKALEECLRLIEDTRAPANLCVDVWRQLSRIILKQIEGLETVEALYMEIQSHESFGKERVEFFVGRRDILRTIGDYVGRADHHLLAVVGEPGSGKSALMARAAEEARSTHPNTEVVVRFIGATPGSSDGRAFLDSLCRQISREYDADQATVPTDYKELVDEFPKRLALATAEKPLILFLDALDQLSDAQQARSLIWLPASLPEYVRLIVSALPGECEAALQNKYTRPQLLELKGISRAEAETLLSLWLKKARRTLQDHQRAEVLSKFEHSDPQARPGERAGLPLYLKLAFEEARLWKSYTDPKETVLREGVLDLIRENLFRRLASPANHGTLVASHSLGYLAASRYGLSEDELLDVLSLDDEVLQDFIKRARHEPPEKRLPVVVWSRIYFDLEPYLTERSADGAPLLAFYHRQLRQAVEMEYFRDGKGLKRHGSLATYFRGKTDPAADHTWTGNYPRGLSELPYHLTHAERWEELHDTLTDFRFLERKAADVGVMESTDAQGNTTNAYTGVFLLQEDFDLALENWPNKDRRHP